MNPKLKENTLKKVYAMSYLYLEALDKLKPTNGKAIKFQNDIIAYMEEMGKEVGTTDDVYSSTYYTELSKKIDVVVRKHLEI